MIQLTPYGIQMTQGPSDKDPGDVAPIRLCPDDFSETIAVYPTYTVRIAIWVIRRFIAKLLLTSKTKPDNVSESE